MGNTEGGLPTSVESRMSRFTYSSATTVELALDITASVSTATFGDVSRIRERIMAIFKSTEALKDIEITGLRVFQVDGKLGIVKFSVPKDNEAVVRQTSGVWLESFMPRAKLQGATWFPVRLDYVPTTLIQEATTGLLSETVKERLSTDNGIQVYASPAFASLEEEALLPVVIKVATRDEQKSILTRATEGPEMTLHGFSLKVRPFAEDRKPLTCYRCHAFGHMQKRCNAQPSCIHCGGKYHEGQQCNATTPKCSNCGGTHKVTDNKCPTYLAEKTKYKNLSSYV